MVLWGRLFLGCVGLVRQCDTQLELFCLAVSSSSSYTGSLQRAGALGEGMKCHFIHVMKSLISGQLSVVSG